MKFLEERYSLANLPTPLQQVTFDGRKFLIKRDDMTGVEMSGNKIRKLEYLLFAAKKKRAQWVYTSGGEQSNHCRATALAAASVGLQSRLYLWGKEAAVPDGNLFIDKFVGAETVYFGKKEYENVYDRMAEDIEAARDRGERVYFIPGGGSSPTGVLGYVQAARELEKQIDMNTVDGIMMAGGTGGTAAGLLVGTQLLGFETAIYAVNVLMEAAKLREDIIGIAEEIIRVNNLGFELNPSLLEVVDGYSDEGYKKITDDKVALIRQFARETGILLDPVYTGKAFYAYNDLILSEKKRPNVVFLHTGGIFGIFAKRKQYLSV